MAQIVGKYAANKLLGSQMKKYQSKKVEGGDVSVVAARLEEAVLTTLKDPYFALIEDPKRPGKMKKVKKQIPAYIPEHDAMVLASAKKAAYRLDMSLFNLFGIRFGWEAVIGIIPAFGDLVGVFMALMIWRKCQKIEGGLDSSTNIQMLINIAIDFVVGLVPFIGDIADAAFKANTKNVRLLERVLDKRYKPSGAKDPRDLAGVDKNTRRQNRKSGIFHPRDPPPATAFEDFDSEAEDRRQFVREQDAEDRVQRPERTRSRNDRQDRGGWFSGGGGSRRERPSDMRQETGSIRR